MCLNLRDLSFTIVALSFAIAGCSANGSVSPARAPVASTAMKSVNAQALPKFDIDITLNGLGVVDEFTSAGSIVRSFSPPSSIGFGDPNGDAYDSKDERLYVDGGGDNPISEFTRNGKYQGYVADPGYATGGATYGIAYDAKGDVLFLQTGDGLYELTPSGTVLASNTTYSPQSLAYDRRDDLVLAVVNAGSSNELAFYNASLSYLGAAPIAAYSGLDTLLWNTKTDLLYDWANGTMYAYKVDAKKRTLTQVTLSGSFSAFLNPTSIINDKAGDLIISDLHGGDVVAFDDEGNYLSTIASHLNAPWGIAIVSK
jgi:hypothetical protein